MALRRRYSKRFCFGVMVAAAALGSGCRSESRSPPPSSGAASQPADTLALSGSGGVEIWFTLARAAQGRDGGKCLERGLEIRRAGNRLPVPLLYTGETPTLVNDTTMRAVLWNHCQPRDPYLVDLRTGRPVRERGTGKR